MFFFLLNFFGGELWIDVDLVDDSTYSVTTSAQDGFSRVQAGKQDGSLEDQDERVITVALGSLNDKSCFPRPFAACELLFYACKRWCKSFFF